MDTIKIDKQKTLMIAHRGLSGIEKENTIASFIAASNRSYYGLECDIHKTTDGKYVIIHDDDLKRVANVDMIVEESSSKELREVNLLDTSNINNKEYYKIPYMEEYLEVAKRYGKECIIEFKNKFKKEDILEVLDIIKSFDYLDHCVFISFEKDNLIEIRKHYKDIRLQLLSTPITEDVCNTCFEYNFGLDVCFKYLTKEYVDLFHSRNLVVNAWTVNSKEDAEKLIDMGIDFITTNILE